MLVPAFPYKKKFLHLPSAVFTAQVLVGPSIKRDKEINLNWKLHG